MDTRNHSSDEHTDRVSPNRFPPLAKSSKSEAGGGVSCRHCGAGIPSDVGEASLRFRICRGCDTRIGRSASNGSAAGGRQRRGLYAAALGKRIDAAIPETFRHARLRGLPENLRRALLSRNRGQGLLVWGPVGTGKTHAVAAVVRAAIVQTRGEIRVERVTYDRLILDLRDSFKPGGAKSELDVLRPYLAADIFWLDDLAASESLAGAASDFQTRTIQSLLNDRMERNLPTFCTSNLSPESLRRVFDERISSRLHSFKIIELRGADRRAAHGKRG